MPEPLADHVDRLARLETELVESIVPTLRIGQLDERMVVASALVAALFGCTCCIMRVSAATELAASSSGLMQADDGIPGHAGCMGFHGSELAPGRHAGLQVARIHRICRMMQRLQLRSLVGRSRGYGAGHAAGLGYTIRAVTCSFRKSGACHAAIWYSYMSPPRTCLRRIRCSARLTYGGQQPACAGASWPRARCGRAVL